MHGECGTSPPEGGRENTRMFSVNERRAISTNSLRRFFLQETFTTVNVENLVAPRAALFSRETATLVGEKLA